MTAPEAIAFVLLDVPVDVRSDDPAVRERLGLWYAAAVASGASTFSAAPIVATIDRGATGYRLEVEAEVETVDLDLTAAVRRFNHLLIHAVMRRRADLFFVHAAVLASGPFGIVLVGLSQSGKSTLALAMIEQGASYLSDELLAYDPRTKTARAVPRALKIRDVCLPYFASLAESFVGAGEGRLLPFTALRPEVVRLEARPRVIIAPVYAADGDDRLVPTTPGAMLLSLTASALNFGTHREVSIDHLAALVALARSYTLRWRDPHGAARTILEAAASP